MFDQSKCKIELKKDEQGRRIRGLPISCRDHNFGLSVRDEVSVVPHNIRNSKKKSEKSSNNKNTGTITYTETMVKGMTPDDPSNGGETIPTHGSRSRVSRTSQ